MRGKEEGTVKFPLFKKRRLRAKNKNGEYKSKKKKEGAQGIKFLIINGALHETDALKEELQPSPSKVK